MNGINVVAIVSNEVAGIEAFWAQCPACGWRCHRRPHDHQGTAARCAQRHQDSAHQDLDEGEGIMSGIRFSKIEAGHYTAYARRWDGGSPVAIHVKLIEGNWQLFFGAAFRGYYGTLTAAKAAAAEKLAAQTP